MDYKEQRKIKKQEDRCWGNCCLDFRVNVLVISLFADNTGWNISQENNNNL